VIDAGHHRAFVGVSLLAICTPGQDAALTIRNINFSLLALDRNDGTEAWRMQRGGDG
jgi:hypothetical protein